MIPIELAESHIYKIRDQKVILDRDLAKLYGVETKILNKAVSRNPVRFPKDFMFRLTKAEVKSLRFQIGTLDTIGRGKYSKYLPYAFTEQGVAMLSGLLNSTRAIAVNIEIMRAFVRMRKIFTAHEKMEKIVEDLRSFFIKRSNQADQEFRKVWRTIEKLSEPPPYPTNTEPMGFKLNHSK